MGSAKEGDRLIRAEKERRAARPKETLAPVEYLGTSRTALRRLRDDHRGTIAFALYGFGLRRGESESARPLTCFGRPWGDRIGPKR